ncbi:MAG: HAMP domain-containing histidine kinase [Nitrospinota bacterium]|nr:HAMP domain-containing histidine kinase [Nitrospinota bacterium]
MDINIKLLSQSAPGKGVSLFDRFAYSLLEREANKQDNVINEELLKELIMKYVSAEKRLAELNQMKNKFLGMAAHDLRNPLASIRGFAELLQEGALDEEAKKEFLEIIRQSADDSLKLINDLLDVSVIESGKFDLDLHRANLAGLIEDRVALMRNIAGMKNISIEVNVASLPDMEFDRGKINQVIDNFVSNAIKYSPAGTTVFVESEIGEGEVAVRVTDQGPGIPEKELAGMFGEFHKTSVRPTGGEKSTGLGLAIVKRIVTAHKGRVGVESQVGKGSVFYFTIPL